MKSHHDDCPHETMEAVIVQTADIISGGRPGARRDSVENYLKRLQELEALVNRHSEEWRNPMPSQLDARSVSLLLQKK
jgi:HD superfamily phosphodiesterase